MTESKPESPAVYRSYLLRIWQEGGPGPDAGADGEWRCSLEEVGGDHRRLGFGSLDAMQDFLAGVVGHAPEEG
jgi:hypothetical protein